MEANMEIKWPDSERFVLDWENPERRCCKEFGLTTWKVCVAEVTFSSQSGEIPNQHFNFYFICHPRCLMDPLSRRSVPCKDMTGSVLSLALISKVVIETQARFSEGPKTLQGPAAEWRWQLSWAALQDSHLKSICPPELSAWAHW